MTLRELCWTYTGLSGRDMERLEEVAASMQYPADLTGADIFIDCLDRAGETAIVVAHARPSGLRSAYHRPVLGQAALLERGFSDFRLRLRDGGALLQVRREQMERARELLPELRELLAADFRAVELDGTPRQSRET